MPPRFFALFAAVFCLILFAASLPDAAAEPSTAEATNKSTDKNTFRAAIVKDLSSGSLLLEYNADARIAPASLTKLMTLLLLFEATDTGNAALEDRVAVGANAARLGGSSMGLRTGEKVRLEELVKGMAIASGNDAAVAAAEYLAGNEKAFVDRMNARAKELGMQNTCFKNPHGLHALGMYTTARDMLVLCTYYVTRHPEALAYHKEQFHTYKGKRHRSFNPLLGAFAGADGLKTGYVAASGYNLAATAKRGETRLLAIFLGAESPEARQQGSSLLLEACFAAVTLQKKTGSASNRTAP